MQANEDFKIFKQDSEAKIEMSLEKCKRMKTLLAKSKQMAQEKEIENAKLLATGSRPTRFGVQNRISLPLHESSSEEQMWCLVYEDVSTSSRTRTCELELSVLLSSACFCSYHSHFIFVLSLFLNCTLVMYYTFKDLIISNLIVHYMYLLHHYFLLFSSPLLYPSDKRTKFNI